MSANEPTTGSTLTRETLLRGLQTLSDQLGKQGIIGEICLFDGAVMVLAFTARLTTKDVDALFQPAQTIRDLARGIADDLHLPADWLNDGVKGFLSARHETTAGNLPQFPHLRLTMPVPEYLLAMKCLAARLGGRTVRCRRHHFLDSPSKAEVRAGSFGFGRTLLSSRAGLGKNAVFGRRSVR